MRRAVVLLLIVAALATGIVFLARPATQASPDVTITVDSIADTNARDDVMTLREAMLLATGELAVTDLTHGECNQVSSGSWDVWCLSPVPIGPETPEAIVFDAAVFLPGSPATISLNFTLPTLGTGGDTIDGSSAGVIVDGRGVGFDCFTITSDSNAIKGLQIHDCYTAITIIWGAQYNTIGGSNPGERNVISGNDVLGVLITGNGTNGNVVRGNYIGTNASGTAALPNGEEGVVIAGGAQSNTVQDNVISGNTYSGVRIDTADSNIVKGNYVGTNAAGTGAVANNVGVSIHEGAQDNTIGGGSPGERNVISGNTENGVYISGVGTNGNMVKGNYIGTDPSGTSPLPNYQQGAAIGDGQDNTIGGTGAGEGNLIAYNEDDGVWVYGADATGNTIRGNSIHSNGDMGIVNSSGGNAELTPPVITGFGSVMGTACANCTVDVYSDDEDEGRVYEGSTTANGAGNWSFGGPLAGPNITATATDATGNTSEFSAPVFIGLCGDVNCGNTLDAVDCLFILQRVVGTRSCSDLCPLPPSPPSLYCPLADTQPNGNIDAVDALFCLQHVVGMRPNLECIP